VYVVGHDYPGGEIVKASAALTVEDGDADKVGDSMILQP
jgi:hypothetical protein